MNKEIGIKAGDFIECEGCMYSDFTAGHSYEVYENKKGFYVLGGLGNKLRLTEVFTFTKGLSGDVHAMCLGATFIKRANVKAKAEMSKNESGGVATLPAFKFNTDKLKIETKLTGASVSFPTHKESFVYSVERWEVIVGNGCNAEKVSGIIVKDDKDALLKIQRFILDLEVSSDEEFKVLVDCKWRRDKWEDRVLSSSLEDLLVNNISRSGLDKYNFWSTTKVKIV